MLSNDKNIETIAQLVGQLKHYFGLQKEYLKLDIVEKLVKVLTATALALILFVLAIAIVAFLSLSACAWLSTIVGGYAMAYLIMGLLHLAVLVLIYLFRKSWIEKPLVKFLAALLIDE